jgi:hypothetical protein
MKLRVRWTLAWTLAWMPAWAALAGAAPGQTSVPQPPTRGSVRLQVLNALFHVTDDVALTVTRLDAWMIPRPGQVVSLDKKNSYTLRIESGETRMKASDLSALMNEYLLPHAKSPIKNLAITFEGGFIVMKGALHKGVDVPFESKGTILIADPTEIRVHFTQMTAAGVIHKGLMDFLGIKLSNVAQPKKQERFRIVGDDIILPIEALFPPPRISGRLTAVRIEGDWLVQVFGAPGARLKGLPVATNAYVYFRGGQVEFGKLTMNDVDLELLNEKPAPQFDFSLIHYYEQLQNGYTKSMPNLGLVVYMPGYAQIASRAKRE